jgi:hypothetical protein
LALAASCALLASGCATVKVQPARLDHVRTVAIVGYDGDYVHHTTNANDNSVVAAINTAKGISQALKGDFVREYDQEAGVTYSIVSRRLAQDFGWQVLPSAQVVANPVYASLREKLKHAPAGLIHPEGFISGTGARKMEPADRAALLKALGVDALVAVEMRYYEARHVKVAVAGAESGKTFVWARIDLTLYDTEVEPAWRDVQADGALSATSMPVVMGVQSNKNQTQAVAEATDYALDTLAVRYNNARAETERKTGYVRAQPAPAAPAEAAGQQPAVAAPASTEQAPAAPAPEPAKGDSSAPPAAAGAPAADSSAAPAAAGEQPPAAAPATP